MLFHSSMRQELGRSFWASWVVLFTIAMTVRLVRTLHDANVGKADPQEIMVALGYAALGQMPAIVSIALFIAAVSVLSRMYRDSEMVIWFGSGRGLLSFAWPLYRFAWPILLGVAAMQWWVWPWTNQQLQELRQQYEQRADLERIAPGQFQESANGQRVFFIEKTTDADGAGRSVFMLDQAKAGNTVTSAKSGLTRKENDQSTLTLFDGQRVETLNDSGQTRVLTFAELATAIEGKSANLAGAGVRGAATLDLLRDKSRAAHAELSWRAGMVLLCTNLLLMALALAQVNPRMGSGGSIAVASLSAIVYFNLATVSQNWVSTGKLSALGSLVLLHGGVLVLTLIWLIKRHHQWHWRLLLPSTAKASS
jgi:lipopolysaccharide export system permease protein